MEPVLIHCDGGSRGNPGFGAAAFVAKNAQGAICFEQGEKLGKVTNNFAEYKAVLLALEWLEKINPKDNVQFILDSQLVVNQLNGIFKIKDKNLIEMAGKIKNREKRLAIKISYKNVPREENKIADTLVNKIFDQDL